ncbi:MAG: hypothetical protein JXP73_17160 [Deltaproteobacteria bacterium]|nr:hypothetical protein [Deltaproteobacteria bacterium]
MGANDSWADPNVSSQGFSLPVAIGPMTLPPPPPKRRWGWVLALLLFVFAGGVAAGPFLSDCAFEGIQAGAGVLARRAPRLLGKYRPPPPVITPETARLGVAPAPPIERASPQVAALPAEAEPSPAPSIERSAAPEQAAAGARTRAAARAAARAETARARAAGARAPRAKGEAKVSEGARAPARKTGKAHDPFESDGSGGGAPAPVKNEPSAPASGGLRSSDSLDGLMADVVTETKGKGKKSVSKDIDAMLKDVQKSGPAPATKREAPAERPPLSPSDISKAMSMVKTRSSVCARRLGQSGIAELTITVGKDGKVTAVRVGGKVSGTPLAACIEKAARAARFRPNAGLRFDYRIDAR